MEEQNKSIGWVAAMLAVVVLYAGWAFMAADFFQHNPDSGGGDPRSKLTTHNSQLTTAQRST